MAIEDKPYIGDVGTILEAEAEKDLTGNSVLQFEILKPSGTTVNWTASIKSGDNSIAQYTIIGGDFNEDGLYKGNLYAEWASGNKWHGKSFCFEVFAIFE